MSSPLDAANDAMAHRPHRRGPAPGVKLIIAAVVILLLIVVGRRAVGPEHLPNFAAIENASEKKDAFFRYLAPHITAVNDHVMEQREHLIEIRNDVAESGDEPGWFDRRWLNKLCAEYDMEPPETYDRAFLDQLVVRVDVIAPSLIMAQAANESAWGTSRFAKLGNNLFGMRTYEPGTGIVPKRRPAGQTWEVAAYGSVRGSIEAYIHNLNTNNAYRQLRNIRRDLRRQVKPITGSALAGGLVRYSEKGYEYVSILRSMIRSNNLQRYDVPEESG